MVAPLLLKERLLGLMLFEHHVDHSYTPRHGRLALAMANHVAVAIENARLYEQAHSLAALKERQKLARELHDSVSHVELCLMEQGGEIILEIRDDGIGFDPQGHFPGHLGLQSMRERVEGADGHLTIQSVLGKGSTIQVRIPGRFT